MHSDPAGGGSRNCGELCRSECLQPTRESITDFDWQTSSFFRALVLSEKRILACAWHTYPFPLPIGTTLSNPPPNFHTLAVRAIRLRERLSIADATKALEPKHVITVAGAPTVVPNTGYDDDLATQSSAPHEIFVFGDIIVYTHPVLDRSLIILDLRNHTSIVSIETKHDIHMLNCQLLKDRSTFRTAALSLLQVVTLSITDYSLHHKDFGHSREVIDIIVPESIDCNVLLDQNLVLASGVADFIICDLEKHTGLHIELSFVSVSDCVSTDPFELILLIGY